jgi:hypothetical protein
MFVDPSFLATHPSYFHFIGQISAEDPSGTWSKYDEYEVSSIVLGNGNAVSHLTVVAMAQPRMWQTLNQAGAPIILGMGILSRFTWHLDLKNNRWSME